MTTKAFIGDSYAVIPSEHQHIFTGIDTKGIPGLPIWDTYLKSLLEEFATTDIVFWSPALHLNGIRRVDKLALLNPDNKLLEFTGRDRYPWSNDVVEHSGYLLENYLRKMDYYINKYPNLVLVPLAAKFQLPDIIEGVDLYSILTSKYPHINLDSIDRDDPANFADSLWHLSEIGLYKLVNLLREYSKVRVS